MDNAGDIALAYTDSAPASFTNGFASNQVKGMLFPANGPAAKFTVTASRATTQPSVAMNAKRGTGGQLRLRGILGPRPGRRSAHVGVSPGDEPGGAIRAAAR
jgi:hypothetical protein